MLKIHRIEWGDSNASSDLDALREVLSIETGQVTEQSIKRTVEVFGEPLSPLSVVRRILDEVRLRGDAAVVKYAEKLDGMRIGPDQFAIDPAEFAAAYNRVEVPFREAIAAAKANIEAFQRHILCAAPEPFKREGVRLETRYRPLRRVGIYIPGGGAPYPSAVLMDVIPAQIAGCKEIAVATAPRHLNDYVMAAFHVLGLKEVYRIGGAQAIGMFAYGTATVPKVDMIVGAGNAFVNLAKREVFGMVKIDMLAGPSEVLVIADETADPDYVAADMLSQAEHYPGSAILVTTSAEVAAGVEVALERQLKDMPRSVMCLECLEKYGAIVRVETLAEAVDVANRVAPEHLEVMTKDPRAVAAQIENAGTVFVGTHTPEPIGDYLAGSSHTLPTGGTARFFSGLSSIDFLKRLTYIEYTEEALKREIGHVSVIARREGLEAHARDAEWRFKKE
jgi:histidinol dehydrogenase